MLPNGVRFLAYTHFTDGFIAIYPGFQTALDGVGLVTKWLSSEGWVPPEPVTSAWTDAYSQPSTTWTEIAP